VTVSAIKSFLPFTSSPSTNRLQFALKIALAAGTVWAGFHYWTRYCNSANPNIMAQTICSALPTPFFRGLMTALSGGVAINQEKEAQEDRAIDAFLSNKRPSFDLTKKILESSAMLDKLLEKIQEHPDILTKKNSEGQTLLLQFADQNALGYRLAGLVITSNHFNDLKEIHENQSTLKKLLLVGHWDKTDLFHTLAVIHRKNSQLLVSWPEVKEQILKRDDLEELENTYLKDLWAVQK